MILYQNTETGDFGLTASAVRLLLPNVSFADGADLTEQGFAPYAEAPAPSADWSQTVIEATPVDGQQQWTVSDRTDELDALKLERLEALASRRKAATQDFSFNGITLRLDPDTENAISKAIQSLNRQPPGTAISWEVSRGVVVPFDLPTLEAIGDAAFLHVQACFTNVAAITSAINTAEDLDDLRTVNINTGWP